MRAWADQASYVDRFSTGSGEIEGTTYTMGPASAAPAQKVRPTTTANNLNRDGMDFMALLFTYLFILLSAMLSRKLFYASTGTNSHLYCPVLQALTCFSGNSRCLRPIFRSDSRWSRKRTASYLSGWRDSTYLGERWAQWQ